MAVSPLLEQRDSRIIVETLLSASKSIKELNEYLLSNNVRISTATIYRRIKELYLADFLMKLDDGSYIVSEHGRMAYNELYKQSKQLDESQRSFTQIINQLSGKESYILKKIQHGPSYTSGMVSKIAISPNDLLKIFDKLIQLQLVQVTEKPGKKPGRPKKIYSLTDNGNLILQQIEELKQKIQRKQ